MLAGQHLALASAGFVPCAAAEGDFNTSQASPPAVPGEKPFPARRKGVRPCAPAEEAAPVQGDTRRGTHTGSHRCSGTGRAPLLSAGASPRCSPALKPSLVPSWHCPGTGMSPVPGGGTARGQSPPPALPPRLCPKLGGHGAGPAGLCKGTLGTAERLPRKTPRAGREQPVSSPGTGQACSLVSLPRGEHAGSRVTAPLSARSPKAP